MILERTITNGDTIKTALLDAERLKKRVTFYTRTRTMIDKFTCRDTENKPITLGRFTISGGLIYYKRGEYSWQNISLDDVLKIDISDPETAPEETPKKRELRPGDRTGIYSKESGKEYIFTGKYDTMTYNGRACVFLATDPENKNTFSRWSQQDLEQRGFIIPEKEQTPKTKRGAFYIFTNSGTMKKDGYIYDSGRNKYGIDNRGTTSRPRWTATDILSGLQVGSERPTKAAAIETALYFENKVIEERAKNSDFMQKALATIAAAYKENPLTNDAPRRPAKYGYFVYKYTSTSGTARAAISTATNPDNYYMDIPESSLPQIMQQISQETPKAYFIDKITGLDIIPEGTPASTPAAKSEPKRNRIPRKFTRLYITMLTDTTAGQAGTRATVYRNQYGELVEETESGKLYAANLALLRSADLVRIDRIETEEPAPDATPADVVPEESPAKAADTTPAPETSPTLYKYGMRSRGYSIAAQPAGVVAREDDPTGIYYDVICYERELTPAEVEHYSLDPLQPAREPAQAASQDTRTTLPPGPEKDPETVTESTTASQEERPLTPQAKPRRGPTRPARTASHTSTHGRHKTPYKAKYKASRTREGPPENPRKSENTVNMVLVY